MATNIIFLFVILVLLYLPNINDTLVNENSTDKPNNIIPFKPRNTNNSPKWYNNFGKTTNYPKR